MAPKLIDVLRPLQDSFIVRGSDLPGGTGDPKGRPSQKYRCRAPAVPLGGGWFRGNFAFRTKGRGEKVMNPRSSKLACLLGSASLLAMAGSGVAQAQAQMAQAVQAEVPEQVLITGSLIRGTAAVGVPVTNLGPQDFVTSGALTTSDLFRSVPSANVTPGPVGTQANANIGKQTRVNIRGLDPNDGTRSLMMVDGYRFPPRGEADCTIDPSIIPQIALDRIDILVDGASATYGSDAIAGVI